MSAEEQQPAAAAEEKPEEAEEPKPEVPEEFSFEGNHDFEGRSRDWKSPVVIRKGGDFTREGGWFTKGMNGTWEVQGKDLILKWNDWEPETVTTEDFGNSFTNEEGFTLTMKEGEPPEWFTDAFKPPEEKGPCITMCLACCPAHVTEHEGEPETIAQQVWSSVEGAVQKLDAGIDKIQDKAEDALAAVADAADAVRDAAIDALGLDDKFKSISDNALDDAAPMAGDMVVEDAVKFIPGFERLDKMTPQDLDGEAKQACSTKILSFRERIHDFCEDVVEFFKEGCDMIGSALKCLYKVVSWILKACRAGVQMAVDLLKKVIPDCCEASCLGCCALGEKITAWIKCVYDKIVDFVEDLIKAALRTFGVPESICEKVDFNGNNGTGRNVSADNATESEEPRSQSKKKLEEGDAAPAQQTMEGAAPEAAAPEPVV